MRTHLLPLLLTVLVAGPLTACGTDADADDTPGAASGSASPTASDGGLVDATLPADLCGTVLSAWSEEYALAEVAHETSEGSASCRLADADGGTTVVVTMTSAPDLDALAAAFEETCRDEVRPAPGDQEEFRCTAETADGIEQAARLNARSALLRTSFTSDDPSLVQLAGAELASAEFALSSG